MNSLRQCLILMLKYPVPGRVKTRLARHIGKANAALLYRSLASRILATCSELDHPLLLSCHPDQKIQEYRSWLGDSYCYISQQGKNLGERMQSSMEQAFELGFTGATLLGTDIPDLSKYILEQAMTGLDRHKAVLGPALDGGYYLLGLSQQCFNPELFKGIPWSTSRVWEHTMKRFGSLGLEPFILPTMRDLDNLEDFKAYLLSQGVDPEAFSSWNEAIESLLSGTRRFPADSGKPYFTS